MKGPHDIGGRAGFGDIRPDPGEPLFHADWERRVLGMTICCGALGHWTLDESRHARESLSPALYYSSSYYGIWLEALETLLLRHGEVTTSEVYRGEVTRPGLAVPRRLAASRVSSTLAQGASTARELDSAPRFRIDDPVQTSADHVRGHDRLPAYARDKRGTIIAVHEPHVLPDASAAGLGERPEWLYSVAFDGETLWGRGGEPGLTITIEAWESYLHAL